jgi:hypothetical protein
MAVARQIAYGLNIDVQTSDSGDRRMKTVKMTTEVETVDIPTMAAMECDEYRSMLENRHFVYVDHHGVLRSGPADYPIATNRQQLDIYIAMLNRLREEM